MRVNLNHTNEQLSFTMGNALLKYQKAKWIDGGSVKEPPTEQERDLVDPWGFPMRLPKDYDYKLVKKLVRQRRLAPFYEGFDSADSQEVKTQKIKRNRPSKDDPEGEEGSYFQEEWLKADLVDCPICLLAFPRNINYTDCCHQPLCSTCFVRMKRPSMAGKPLSCPFCKHENFAVLYHKPRWLLELQKPTDERDLRLRPEPVAAESLKLLSAQEEALLRRRRQNEAYNRLYAQNAHLVQNQGQQPRRYIFYEPSGTYTFYDNNYYRQPAYYQHYQQQQHQRTEAYERAQMEEAIRQSLIESSRAAQEYARGNC